MPVISADPSQAMPIGVGDVAQGGNTVTVQAALGQFLAPMDVYAAYGISTDPDKLFVIKPDLSVQVLSYSDVVQAIATGTPPAGAEPFMAGTMGPVNQVLENTVSVSQLEPGTYTFYLLTAPAGSLGNFYLWKTSFDVQGLDGTALYAQNCSACHGETGQGNGVLAPTPAPTSMAMGSGSQKPFDFTDPRLMLGASPALLQGKLIRGGMGTGMPSWGPLFTEAQTWAYVDYLWTFQFEYSSP